MHVTGRGGRKAADLRENKIRSSNLQIPFAVRARAHTGRGRGDGGVVGSRFPTNSKWVGGSTAGKRIREKSEPKTPQPRRNRRRKKLNLARVT